MASGHERHHSSGRVLRRLVGDIGKQPSVTQDHNDSHSLQMMQEKLRQKGYRHALPTVATEEDRAVRPGQEDGGRVVRRRMSAPVIRKPTGAVQTPLVDAMKVIEGAQTGIFISRFWRDAYRSHPHRNYHCVELPGDEVAATISILEGPWDEEGVDAIVRSVLGFHHVHLAPSAIPRTLLATIDDEPSKKRKEKASAKVKPSAAPAFSRPTPVERVLLRLILDAYVAHLPKETPFDPGHATSPLPPSTYDGFSGISDHWSGRIPRSGGVPGSIPAGPGGTFVGHGPIPTLSISTPVERIDPQGACERAVRIMVPGFDRLLRTLETPLLSKVHHADILLPPDVSSPIAHLLRGFGSRIALPRREGVDPVISGSLLPHRLPSLSRTGKSTVGCGDELAGVQEELLSTERDYVRHLRVITEVILRELADAEAGGDRILGKFDRNRVFNNIQAIETANSAFLAALEEISEGDVNALSAIMAEHLHGMAEPYEQYMLQFEGVEAQLKSLNADYPRWRDFLQRLYGLKEVYPLHLIDLLVKPAQRMARYRLLIEVLLRNISDDTEAHKSFGRAWAACDRANKMERTRLARLAEERLRALEKVQAMVDGCPKGIVSGSNQLLMDTEGNELHLLSGNKGLSVGFWLTETDLLIATKRKASQVKWDFCELTRLEDLTILIPEGSAATLVLRCDAFLLSPYWDECPLRAFVLKDPKTLETFIDAVNKATVILRASYAGAPEILSAQFAGTTIYSHLHTAETYSLSEWRSDVLLTTIGMTASSGEEDPLSWYGESTYRDPDTVMLLQQRKTGKLCIVARSRLLEDPVDPVAEAARRQALAIPAPLYIGSELSSAFHERVLIARRSHVLAPDHQWARQRHVRMWMQALQAHPLLQDCLQFAANPSAPAHPHAWRSLISSTALHSLWSRIRHPRKSSSMVFPQCPSDETRPADATTSCIPPPTEGASIKA